MNRSVSNYCWLLVVAFVAVAILWWMRQPVMIRSSLLRTTVFGPLRDRSPERAGETFLLGIANGRCETLEKKSLPKVEFVNTSCERETANPLSRWELTDIVRIDRGRSQLVYAWGSANVPISHGNAIEIEVTKFDAVWHVVTYARVF